MIYSFKNKETEKVWKQIYSKRYPLNIQQVGLRKLILINRSKDINDLRIPPGNRLEQLSCDRKGQHSIRINSQWRICFFWNNGFVTDVEITDYH